MKTTFFILVCFSCIFSISRLDTDAALDIIVDQYQLNVLEKPEMDSMKVILGQNLFYDKILSGNRDVSCATCHHPAFNSSDGLVLPIGVGGFGLGTERKIGYDRTHIPRNSPEIFNRGANEWHTMFWDSRVNTISSDSLDTPAEEKLPPASEFDNLLAVQAMFPVFSRDEMRGEIGDLDVHGEENELALISNAAPQSVWFALMERLLEIPDYVDLFQRAYPETPAEELGFQHAANAIAAFEIEAFTYLDSPWDRFLSGEENALTDLQKEGAVLFYGKAGCVKCHSGNLMTDQEHHNIGVPQFGPGKGAASPLDVGRYLETGKQQDKFSFRTPPLRNVAYTAPYMHNGAYQNLDAAIRHHFNPKQALKEYRLDQIPGELRSSYQDDPSVQERMVKSLDPLIDQINFQPTGHDIRALVAFMEALTDSSMKEASKTIPENVPSGLPVDM